MSTRADERLQTAGVQIDEILDGLNGDASIYTADLDEFYADLIETLTSARKFLQ